ncbi:MAG: flagellar hook-basal body protein [bacterium]|jgi:flagellar basal-body rod protein FlgG|nr:flagellar hook-basal body protein [candidate division KSB1 bacterium]MDH7559322.1 flagellar hook-basal body protein [bacterium]
MIKGFEYSTEGMNATMLVQDIIANNLANVSTTGFKSGKLFISLLEQADASAQLQEKEGFDLSQGALKKTDNPWDLALEGPGFFVVQSARGTFLTRNGAFAPDAEGYLVTQDGSFVLGERGRILAGEGVTIGQQGEVMKDGVQVDRLRIVHFADARVIERHGQGLFVVAVDVSPTEPPAETRVHQGYLEQSNVDPLREMVAMMYAFRLFEADAKALKSQDDTLGRAVNEVAQVK